MTVAFSDVFLDAAEYHGASGVQQLFDEWPDPIEGAERGDVESAVTRDTWARR